MKIVSLFLNLVLIVISCVLYQDLAKVRGMAAKYQEKWGDCNASQSFYKGQVDELEKQIESMKAVPAPAPVQQFHEEEIIDLPYRNWADIDVDET